MDQCEDREEGVPPSKTTLCGEDESQSKGQRIHQRLKPEPEPEPSCVSFKSNRSKYDPINFKSPGSPPSESLRSSMDSQSGKDSWFFCMSELNTNITKLLSVISNQHDYLRKRNRSFCSSNKAGHYSGGSMIRNMSED